MGLLVLSLKGASSAVAAEESIQDGTSPTKQASSIVAPDDNGDMSKSPDVKEAWNTHEQEQNTTQSPPPLTVGTQYPSPKEDGSSGCGLGLDPPRYMAELPPSTLPVPQDESGGVVSEGSPPLCSPTPGMSDHLSPSPPVEEASGYVSPSMTPAQQPPLVTPCDSIYAPAANDSQHVGIDNGQQMALAAAIVSPPTPWEEISPENESQPRHGRSELVSSSPIPDTPTDATCDANIDKVASHPRTVVNENAECSSVAGKHSEQTLESPPMPSPSLPSAPHSDVLQQTPNSNPVLRSDISSDTVSEAPRASPGSPLTDVSANCEDRTPCHEAPSPIPDTQEQSGKASSDPQDGLMSGNQEKQAPGQGISALADGHSSDTSESLAKVGHPAPQQPLKPVGDLQPVGDPTQSSSLAPLAPLQSRLPPLALQKKLPPIALPK